MGRLIERLAVEKGYEIVVAADESTAEISVEDLATNLRGVDVAIDFSTAEAVRRNVEACVAARVPLVEGTTGWINQRDEIERVVRDGNGAFVYGANFSVGVNIFYRIAARTAELMRDFPEYEGFIEEQHHSRKRDAPSGTALELQNIAQEILSDNADKKSAHILISSTRAGNIPGTHTLGFDGPADQITLMHTARSREGFARGAILAAEWIVGKVGIYEFPQVFDELLPR